MDEVKIPNPEEPASRQFVYDLVEAAVVSILFCNGRDDLDYYEIIKDFRGEVKDRLKGE